MSKDLVLCMSKGMVRQEEEFGKDHGLIHEAVVTGRKAGAGREFWAELAHNEELFQLIVGVVSERIPGYRVTVRDGIVQRIEKKTEWNKSLSTTIEVERKGNGRFVSYIGDPEHGGGTKEGTLTEVLSGLHPNVAKKYIIAFRRVEKPIKEFLETIGFKGCTVIQT